VVVDMRTGVTTRAPAEPAVVLVAFSPVVSGTSTAMVKGEDWHRFPLSNPGIVSIPIGLLRGWIGTLLSRESNPEKYAELDVRVLPGVGAH
jgi:cation/acetate symporter